MDDKRPSDSSLEELAPLVDEALAAVDRKDDEQAELQALRSELARLKDAAHGAASEAGRIATHDIRQRIRSQPFSAAVTVGVIAFLYGLTR